jgi:hypothetical protein
MGFYKWKPSKKAAKEFAAKMEEIRDFCSKNLISMSASGDSYYFTINGQEYRVSNHSVEASNAKAYSEVYGKVREVYHPGGRDKSVIYIHASKTRIIEIYNDLQNGYQLDGRGHRKEG